MNSKNPFELNPQDTTAAYIDGPSLYWAYKTLDTEAQMDFLKLRDLIERNSRLQSISYYSVLPPREHRDANGHTPIKPLADFLEFNGFRILLKEGYQYATDIGVRTKGSIAFELGIDALNAAWSGVNHVMLFLNNDDYIPLVREIQRKGCRVTLCSTDMNDVAPASLIRSVDNFIELEEIASLIARDKNKE